MLRTTIAALAVCLLLAGTASAQIGGGGGRGGGGHGGGGGGHSGGKPSGGGGPSAPAPPTKPVDASMIVGVVKAIDATAGRITIAYEPVEARNWPAGTMPFQAEKPEILKDTKVGEKVRFRLESQQIAEIIPYVATSSTP